MIKTASEAAEEIFNAWGAETERVGATTFSPRSLGFLKETITQALTAFANEQLKEVEALMIKSYKEAAWFAQRSEKKSKLLKTARARALEEAAKMLDDSANGDGTTELQQATLEHFARKLRVLKGKP